MTEKQDLQSEGNESQHRATALFLEYHNLVRQLAFRVAPSADLVNDIAHDVFVNFVTNADQWDLDRDVVPLLWKITQNIAKRHWRTYTKNLPGELAQVCDFLRSSEPEPEIGEVIDQRMELLALDLCIEKLSSKYRTLLEAYYFGEAKLVELAEVHHIKIGTLQKTMCRIRSALLTCIERVITGRGPDHV